jgi:3-hydroxybutyryl-CoA dehydrogenase
MLFFYTRKIAKQKNNIPVSLPAKAGFMFQTICVCGAGTMGSGIAQVSAAAGFYTLLYELNETVLENAKIAIDKNLQQLVEKGRLTAEQKEKTFSRIVFTNDLYQCLADVVIEAIVEKPEAKIAMFNQLAEINHGETIFATNTSSLSITAIAKGILHPQRVVGLHFFNPAPLMKLVEVVKAEQTSDEVANKMMAFAQQLGKVPVLCRDAPGFIVNRVARPYYIESLRIAEEGHSSIEQIDMVLEATGFKMGPFKLMDLIGNDINYAVSCSVYEQLGRPERLKPSALQQEKVEKGELGRKTKKGYYNY